jgi:hypothetical protein
MNSSPLKQSSTDDRSSTRLYADSVQILFILQPFFALASCVWLAYRRRDLTAPAAEVRKARKLIADKRADFINMAKKCWNGVLTLGHAYSPLSEPCTAASNIKTS